MSKSLLKNVRESDAVFFKFLLLTHLEAARFGGLWMLPAMIGAGLVDLDRVLPSFL
jgi:hypothetical protein